MAKIENEAAYQAALRRVEQLEKLVDDDNPMMDDNAMELDMLIDMIEEYEDIHYPIGQKKAIRKKLIEKLKEKHCFWSYDVDSITDVPDGMLVELVMIYLDLADIDLLFQLFPKKEVKRMWLENVVAQGERYHVLNRAFAWYYFGIKCPDRYVKAMETRLLKKRLNLGAHGKNRV